VKIIRHRGQEQLSRNMLGSYEIDVRLCDDEDGDPSDSFLILRHDLHGGMRGEPLGTFLSGWLRDNVGQRNLLALNVKQDGLAPMLNELLQHHGILQDQYFCFDMAQPEIPIYAQAGLPLATRASQYGIEYPMGEYIWFDWYPHVTVSPASLYQELTMNLTRARVDEGALKIVAVSPELHGEYKTHVREAVWSLAREKNFWGVCTKFADEAEKFFNDSKGNTMRPGRSTGPR